MKNKLAIIFISAFIAIISVPFVLLLLKIKVTPQNKNEKKISLNFKRNFPLRKDLFDVYAYTKTHVFKTQILPSAVVEAKDGWLFLGNKFSNALSESKGLLVFNKKEIQSIKENLLNRKKWLDERDIKLYITVAPNKHSIYGDLIPIKKRDRNTKMQQLDSLCKTIDISFTSLGSKFPKNDATRLYHKTDSHWNHIGGFYGYQSTLETISKDFKTTAFNPYTLDDIELNIYKAAIGDLNRALFLEQKEEFIDLSIKRPFTFKKLENTLTPPSDYHFGAENYEERYSSDANDLKIIVLRDSFFGAYYKFIANSFGESLFIWRHNFNAPLLESEKPNILCYEIVERNIDLLLTDDFKHSPD